MSHQIEHSRQAIGSRDGVIREVLTTADGFEGYDAAREGVVVYPRGPRGVLVIGGSDAAAFLHGILTNDIQKLAPGEACYAAYLTPQGRMVSDMDVHRRTGDLLLDVEPVVSQRLVERLDGSIFAEDVTVTDRSADVASIGVYGPRASAMLAEVGAPPPQSGELTVLATDRAGVGGFHAFSTPETVARLADALANRGAVRLGAQAAESLRIEAGIPRFGTDMTEDTIPLEAGIEARAISMTKGCYIGQEVIVRILHRGHGRVARKLVALQVEGETMPPAGSRLSSGEKDAGHVTSAARSPRFGMIALGYVHRDLIEPGTTLRLGDEGRAALVVKVPMQG